MKICIAGKNSIAIDILDKLISMKKEDNSLEIVAICNITDDGCDRWQKSFRKYALKLGIEIVELDSVYKEENLLFLSLEFDKIIVPEKFQSKALFNVHFSLLPQYKGMYTSAHPLLNGDKYTGVTLHKIDNGIDTGDILDQKKIVIEDSDFAKKLYCKYLHFGTQLALKWIDKLVYHQDELCFYAQNAYKSTYYSKSSIDYSNLKIKLNKTAFEIFNQIRAFNFRDYQMPQVIDQSIIDSKITDVKTNIPPGQVIEQTTAYIKMATIDYDIILWKDRLDELFLSIKNNDIFNLKEICKVSRHINDVDADGCSPLMYAIKYNRNECVSELIRVGACLWQCDYNGRTVQEYAKEAGMEKFIPV